MNAENRYLSPAEVVRRLGVSVRALKLYERHGLLAPVKTSAGWRTYGPDQISRLHEILALKGLGLSLSRIAELLAGRESDLTGTLKMQAAALVTQRDRANAALRLIGAALQKLAEGEALPTADLIDLIRETTLDAQPAYLAAYVAQLERQLTPDELDRLRHGWEGSRQALIAELKTLTEHAEDPASATSLDFMRRWSHFHLLAVGGDNALGLKARAAWRDAMADPEAAKEAPYGDAEVGFIMGVVEAVRAETQSLLGRVEDSAQAGADPGSAGAMALVLRLRRLSNVFHEHRTKAWRDERRTEFETRKTAADVPLSDAGLAFLTQAAARADALIDAA